MTHPIRIVIADDHPMFRDGLRRVLEGEPGLRIVGEAGTGREAVTRVSELSPDVLLLDLCMPGGDGLDVLRALEPDSTVRTILLTAEADSCQMVEALLLGARGVVLKNSDTTTLTKCIPAVMSGHYWYGRDLMPDVIAALRQLRQRPAPAPAQTLTRRELRVVAAVLAGSTNKDIASALGLSEQTIKNYLSHIYDKLGVSSRLELALYAIHHKLPTEPELARN